MKKVCIVGLGYIGLPTACLLAKKKYMVHGVDINPAVIRCINSGVSPINEPGLDVLVSTAVKDGTLKAFESPTTSDIYIIAVPTPFKDQHKPDLSYVDAAVKAISTYLQAGNLIILESTSPVGTTERIAEFLRKSRPDLSRPDDLLFAHCPERVLPGKMLKELIHNARIVGGINAKSSQMAKAFYKSFVEGEIYITDARTAEMAKLTENSFRDVNIAFANEISLICEQTDINVWELINLANQHPRVNILQPGPGVGGHCIAVDPWFIVDQVPDSALLIRTAREVNDAKPISIINKIEKEASKFKNPTIACLGLAFKADVADLRESPALKIVFEVARADLGDVLVIEPHIDKLPDSLQLGNVKLTDLSRIADADIIALLVDHSAFRNIEVQSLTDKVIIDTRGFWNQINADFNFDVKYG